MIFHLQLVHNLVHVWNRGRHAFGPRSHEVQDIYARLDKTIGALFDALDAQVGKDRWVVALSSDHGVTAIPEQLVAEGKDGGRIDGTTMFTWVVTTRRAVTSISSPLSMRTRPSPRYSLIGR